MKKKGSYLAHTLSVRGALGRVLFSSTPWSGFLEQARFQRSLFYCACRRYRERDALKLGLIAWATTCAGLPESGEHMMDAHWSEKLEELLQSWERLYQNGFLYSASQLCRDGSSDFIERLQGRIDQRKAEIDEQRKREIEDALDRWQEECDEGRDCTAKDLCPDWPDERLKVLERRIATRREKQERVLSMLDENNEADGNTSVFKPGSQVLDLDYKFEKLLGEGGFGQAWLAKNDNTGRQAVFKFCSKEALHALKNETELLKRIREELQEDERFKDRFVQMLESHLKESPHYVMYEYIPEGDLRKYMRTFGRCFNPIESSEIIFQLAETMALVHTLPDPVIHRDSNRKTF